MSGGIRVSLAAPGATAAQLVALARIADEWNLAGVWAGAPTGDTANADDSYVMAAAAAAAAATTDVRLGVFLGLGDERQVVRLAEDIAVVDQASGGRLELGLRAGDAAWPEQAGRLLRAWNAWQLPGRDETVPVLPGPAQPVVPRVVVGDEDTAEALVAGRVLLEPEPSPDRLVARRRILLVDAGLGERPDAVHEWLASGSIARVRALRELALGAGAQELLLLVHPDLHPNGAKELGTVVVPSLRAADRDVDAIAGDAWVWLTRKTVLHAPPPREVPAGEGSR